MDLNSELHKQLAGLDKRLNNILARPATFVSIDIADSTGIKQGESEEDVIFSFLAYQKMCQKVVEGFGGEIMSITGDGIMGKFTDADKAMESAIYLLSILPEFNKSVNLLKTPLGVRIGINTGKVFVDSENTEFSTPQRVLPSQAIDLAGYLQKRASVNSIWVSQFSVEQMAAPVPGLVRNYYDEKIGFAIYVYIPVLSQPPVIKKRTQVPKVLIVEDEPDQAYEMARLFHEADFKADIAFDGPEALIHYKAFEPDVVILDIGLARWDGWEVLDRLRQGKKAAPVPVIMMGRRYKMGDIERSLEMGASGCVRKPIHGQTLVRKVRSLLY